ncbi:hypothetical protein ES319_D12G293900v1 [Gossypium barbadense]|uniref:DDT domain-containing protein n=2 Tax=Gossypium TaxID=3633 RepID=A0A5J5P6R1_GOSBA|nr:hypothetical protein ES319_D12G293900v1 [Gossypium barbadense]TYG43092.1 hypothetical protein ES288_D12G309500v1 [Gossypium darwinii]
MAVSPSPSSKKKNKNKKSNNANIETTRPTDSAYSTDPPPPQLSPKRRRNSSPGVRLIHGRIYDSQNGKTCHQCRQKTVDFAASCKTKINGKQCTIHFCHKCLLNRYGEKAEEVALLNDWTCPRCRGICNCSFCMKKRGHQPTGVLVHAAKANGFASVSDMLHLKDSKKSGSQEPVDVAVSSKKRKAAEVEDSEVKGTGNSRKESSCKEPNGLIRANDKRIVTSNTKLIKWSKNGKEIVSEGNDLQKISPKKLKTSMEVSNKGEVINDMITAIQLIDMKVPMKCDHGEDEVLNNADPVVRNKPICRSPNLKKKNVKAKNEASDAEIVLPQGTSLNHIDGIDLPVKDVGHALQFLEFCEVFGEVLNMKKGQSQLLLKELFTGKSKRKHKLRHPSIVQFHILLLSMMQKDLGKEYPCLNKNLSEKSWVQILGEYINDSQYPLKQPLLDCLDVGGGDKYERLNSSKKLKVLNFLCDEALSTTDFRSWIDKQNLKFVERQKKAKEKLLSQREKERNLEKEMKKKLQDEIAKAILMRNGAPLSISENEELLSRIKSEVAQTLEVARTLASTLEVSETVVDEEDEPLNPVRSEPIFWDGDGHRFWKLRSYSSETNVLLQDIEGSDLVAAKEKWYTYSTEQKPIVEKYISSFRMQRK